MARGGGKKKFLEKRGHEKTQRSVRASEKAKVAKRNVKEAIQHDESFKSIPKSIIIRRGKMDASYRQLVMDFRTMFEPYSSKHLQESKRHVLRDFVEIAPIFAATHLQIFSMTKSPAAYWKVGVLPNGPEVDFSVKKYSLAKDVRSAVCRNGEHLFLSNLWQKSAVVVLNGFGSIAESDPRVKVVQSLLLNLLPKVECETARLSDIKRVVYFSIDKETQLISLRHYMINSSNSEGEEVPTVGIKLTEIGPSMDLMVNDIKTTVKY